MSFLADIRKCAREQARLELDSMAVAVPGDGGHSGHALKGQSPGTKIYFAPQTEAGPPGPAWAPSWGRFFIRFQGPAGQIGPRRKNQGSTERTRALRDGPARRIRATQDRSGPVRRIKALRDKSGTTERIRSNTNRGPTGRIKAPNVESGPAWQIRARKTDQGPAGQAGPRGTSRAPRDGWGPAGRSRAPQDESGPGGRTRAPMEESGPRRMNQDPQDVPGPRKTNQAPAGRIRASVRIFFSRSKFTEQIFTPQQGWNSQFCFWSQRIYNGGRICYISYVFMVPY